MLPKQLVIIGGGASINDGIKLGLFDLIPNIFSCGLNYAYKYVNTTVNLGVDETFWNANYKDLINLPLYIGKEQVSLQNHNAKNAYFFPPNRFYNRDLIGGVYKSTLAGLFALSLFIKFIDEGEIFLLGADYGGLKDKDGKYICDKHGRIMTHFYQDWDNGVNHRGISKLNWYTATMTDSKDKKTRITNAENEYRVYKDENKIKIYNVSPQSAIPTFEKISYEQFFEKIDKTPLNQEEIRKELHIKCQELNHQLAVEKALKNPGKPNIQNKKGPFNVN